MRSSRKWYLVAAAALAMCGMQARAAGPIYTFETLYDPPVGGNPPQPDPAGTRPDGFHANGGGFAVTQDTVGATDGTHSVKGAMVGGATFVGLQTELIPAAINDPNTTALAFDLTIPATGTFTGNFARMGLKEFGAMGEDAQTDPTTQEVNIALAPGTYHLQLALIAAFDPVSGDQNVPFSKIFGPGGEATPTSFEFYINKSNDSPLTVYMDNVTALTMPSTSPPLLGDMNGDGQVDFFDVDPFVEALLNPTQYAIDFPGVDASLAGDINQDQSFDFFDVDPFVQLLLTGHFPATVEQSAELAKLESLAAVPEPATTALLIAAAPMLMLRRRSRAR